MRRMRFTLSFQVLFDSKMKAAGVEYLFNGYKHSVWLQTFSKSEVIISGGSINSPQLLMLSGIGPQEHLTELGVSFLKKTLEMTKNFKPH